MPQLNLLKMWEILGPRRRGPKTFQTRRRIFRNSKQWLEPKKLLTLEGSESKTHCAMIKISAWQRLCVYSPEVTGSCLLTSVAITMEPRKVRKLKVLTGFRPVSDQFHTLRPAASKPWHAPAKKEQKLKHKGRKKKYKNRIAVNVKVKS